MGTDKGYTGQFHDAVSGLDYYNARYYDPVMAQFLSADHVQGNAQGFDLLATRKQRRTRRGKCS